jgi:hypothetical protein
MQLSNVEISPNNPMCSLTELRYIKTIETPNGIDMYITNTFNK